MARVLLVEDDDAIRTSLSKSLTAAGHVVTALATGAEAVAKAARDRPEVVLLDLGLPDLDGRDVLAMVRSVSDVPVIVATARDDDASVVKLLDAGADDYVIKPFSSAQIDARIRAVLRRLGNDQQNEVVNLGSLEIDPRSREVTVDGKSVDLTRKEFDLLLALSRRPGAVVSKRELLAEVWGLPWGGGDRTVDVHLSWLRRKLGETAAEPRFLHSVRGVGVKLAAPESS
ncbi:DNA-binding response OmpR family regulator [Kribbella sp. VKM Ac-2527]|uniref:DNA-binding response OmpR family regulator n=1 Tax=Kribbella caucasensis TaxID=2512215 RepID=A0A4R6KJD5_9ACTN|nr:response regulator transcription factor [Kribbella sp. VKM Ac-2527]TDO51414.1 DNA-binding response OmpR family regulator [Kribbella sp. VKM Ac-2527]